MNKENGLLRKGQAVNLFIGAPFLSARDLSQYEVQLRVVGEQSDLKSAGQGFNASYKHLRLLFGPLRRSAYSAQTKGALILGLPPVRTEQKTGSVFVPRFHPASGMKAL